MYEVNDVEFILRHSHYLICYSFHNIVLWYYHSIYNVVSLYYISFPIQPRRSISSFHHFSSTFTHKHTSTRLSFPRFRHSYLVTVTNIVKIYSHLPFFLDVSMFLLISIYM